MEIERKYLVTSLPSEIKKSEVVNIEQVYLAFEPEVRIRRANEDYTMTVKSGKGLSRQEVEFNIGEKEYQEMKSMSTSIIDKTRYIIPVKLPNNKTYNFELDIYLRNLTGLITVEIEFNSIEESLEFQKYVPEWIGAELTENDGFKNRSLARYGVPEIL